MRASSYVSAAVGESFLAMMTQRPETESSCSISPARKASGRSNRGGAGSATGPAAAAAPEVALTRFGRKSGRPSRNTIWIPTDAHGRIHIRSGQALVRDWPQNLLASGRAILHIDGKDVPVQARHVTDRAELLASRDAVKAKYGRE